MSLADLKTQEAAIAVLKGYIQKGSVPHAMLFSGPLNSGQKEMAAELAKVLFCEKPVLGDSCGICAQCHLVNQGTHPDFVTLSPEEDSMEIKVAAVRELIAKANLKPFQARAKLFYIDPADALNDIAQNALLKTLEEPAGNTYIVLASYANEKILPTVRSRTQAIHFKLIDSLESRDTEVENLRKETFNYLFGEGSGRLPDLSSLEREQTILVLELVMQGLRDVALMKSGASEVLGAIEDRPMKERVLNHFSLDEILDKIEMISEYKEKAVNSANLKLLCSVFLSALEPKKAT